MCLTHAVKAIVHRLETELGTSLNELLEVHESYHSKAFPFNGSYKQLLKQQHSIPFTEYDAILMYRVLYYMYDAINPIDILPEQFNETIAPCVLSLLSLMLARHVSPVLCALKTFTLSTTHDILFKPIYRHRSGAFPHLFHASLSSVIQACAVDFLTEALQETSYAKYIKLYCRQSRYAICCPMISTSFIDQVLMQFLLTSSPFLSKALASEYCSCDRSMVHALKTVEKRCTFRYLDKSRLYLPDISCGTSFGPPVSCFSDQNRPGPVRLTWLPVSRTVMSRDDPLYPITKSPVPCTCCNSSKNSLQTSTCTLGITARVNQLFLDFLSLSYKVSKDSGKAADTLSFLKYLETTDTKDLCSCIKRDLLAAAQLDMLHELDKLLQEGSLTPYPNPTVKKRLNEIAQIFSMLYYDVLTLECRSTGQYATLSTSYNHTLDNVLGLSTGASKTRKTNSNNEDISSYSDCIPEPASISKKKRPYRVFTKAFEAKNLALNLFIKECNSCKDLDSLGISKSSVLLRIMTSIHLQNKDKTSSSTFKSKDKRILSSSSYAQPNTSSHEGDSLRYILAIMTSSLYSPISPSPTSHPFYFSTSQLYKFILLNNSASPWILNLIEQIRTKDIQIVRHRVLPAKRMSVYECSRQCSCPLSCLRRCVQFGKRYRLQIFRQRYGYWGLRTLDYIPKGAPVCEYTGDLIGENLAERRGAIADMQRCSYLYDIVCVFKYCFSSSEKPTHKDARGACSGGMRLGLSSHGIRGAHVSQENIDSDDSYNRSVSDLEASTIYVVDATRAGNEGRYANHRTRDNIVAKRIIWDDDPTTSHFAHPHLYFFATTDIKPMEELFLNYMYKDDGDGLIKLKYPWAFDSEAVIADTKEEIH
ncbi:Histone methyltransferase HMT2 [Giardia lamblia P15]|uniref:Histone methyltransferase HMT2 n=1 Tax=Giardia intestinalis (strain P15) TaxID=658858 RepID=E1EXP4_GIAIA|nr:Histone methyltransferase HMT2 [Giardia lamblia P15]